MWNKKPKYRNKVVVTPDGKFDSEKELRRWHELLLLQKGKVITDLVRQPSFTFTVNGNLLKYASGRKLTYRADFSYQESGKLVVEDVKGFKTKEYKIKWALMKYANGIEVKEI